MVRRVLVASSVVALAACGDDHRGRLSTIVFTRENQWNHPSNPTAAEALRALAERRDWDITVTDDPATFTPAALARTHVVVFSLTSGNVLDEATRGVLETYFTTGGGFVGTHSASSTEHDWPFYKTLVPVTFKTHPTNPAERAATLTLGASDHPIVVGVPDPWMRVDEWYTFYERPEELGLDILLVLDESSLGADYGDDLAVGYHPLAWTHAKHGGRAFYTALGHTPESYAEPAFMAMLEHAIEWAAER